MDFIKDVVIVKNGYTVLYPEELSLDEQISIFSKYETPERMSLAYIDGLQPIDYQKKLVTLATMKDKSKRFLEKALFE